MEYLYPINIYLIKVDNTNTRKNMWNISKVTNKDTKATSLTSIDASNESFGIKYV